MIVLKGRRRGGSLMAFGPDSRTLAVRSETGLQIWTDPLAGGKPKIISQLNAVASLQFFPDGERLFCDGRAAAIVHISSGEFELLPQTDGYRYTGLSHDCRLVFSSHVPKESTNYTLECRTLARDASKALFPALFSGKPIWRKRLSPAYSGRPLPLADGSFVVSMSRRKDIPTPASPREYWHAVRSGKDGSLRGETKTCGFFCEREAASADCRWLAGQNKNALRIWSLADLGKPPIERINPGSKKIFTDIAFHPSGRYLAATSTDETVKFYETESWQVARTFSWRIGKLVGVAFSPDGALAAAGSDDGRIVIWDVDE